MIDLEEIHAVLRDVKEYVLPHPLRGKIRVWTGIQKQYPNQLQITIEDPNRPDDPIIVGINIGASPGEVLVSFKKMKFTKTFLNIPFFEDYVTLQLKRGQAIGN